MSNAADAMRAKKDEAAKLWQKHEATDDTDERIRCRAEIGRLTQEYWRLARDRDREAND